MALCQSISWILGIYLTAALQNAMLICIFIHIITLFYVLKGANLENYLLSKFRMRSLLHLALGEHEGAHMHNSQFMDLLGIAAQVL